LAANFLLDLPHLQEEPKEDLMKTPRTRSALPALALSVTLLLPSLAFAQHAGKGQSYAFGAVGAQKGVAGVQVGGGFGHERFLYKGLGLGGEAGGFAGPEARFVLSANGSYHFGHASQKLVPFGTAGVSALAACGDGCGAVGAFNFGGGINYWFRPNRGLRLEVRDYMFDNGGTAHKWEMRVGFAF
jgi:hypothetical protein